jgi:hypothetical protein
MRLYGVISKVEPQDDGTVKVEGIASSEAIDDQGEIVRSDAIRAAIPDYMRFPALREMHQLSAAGSTLEAEVSEDGTTRIVAHVVDPVAVAKVRNQVYRGFSIGGQVTERDHTNRKIITGLRLNEISLVDRPANPEAIFDCWKAAAVTETIEGTPDMPDGLANIGEILAAKQARAEPVQVWACGNAEHRHLAKAEAVKCLDEETAKAAESPAEGATVAETGAGTETPAETAEHATAAPDETQAALEAARAAMERGQAVLARMGAPVEPPAIQGEATEAEEDPAAKGGDASGDGSKPYGDVSYADSGHQADGKKRYPIDTPEHIRAAWNYINKPKNAGKYSAEDLKAIKSKIISAWKSKIDKDGPPSASEKAVTREDLAKHLMDVAQVADTILRLDSLSSWLAIEAEMEGDDSPQPSRLQTIVAELCDFLNALVAEETQEIVSDSEMMVGPLGVGPVNMSAIITSLHKTISDPAILEALVNSVVEKGARFSASDTVHADNAAYAIGLALDMSGPSKTDKVALGDARKAVIDSGACSVAGPPLGSPPPNATQDTGRNGEIATPQSSAGAVPASPMPKASDTSLLANALSKMTSNLSKAGGEQAELVLEFAGLAGDMQKAGAKPHQVLVQMAHKSVAAFCDGSTCKADVPDPERHDGQTMASMHKAHGCLTQVGGVTCAGGADHAHSAETPGGTPMPEGEEEGQGASSTAKAVVAEPDALAKVQGELALKTALNEELVKTVTAIVPMLTKLQEWVEKMGGRVEQIASTPFPPMAVVRGGTPTTKAADNAPAGSGQQPTHNDVADALAAMSPQDRDLAIFKGTRTPMPLPRSLAGLSELRDRQAPPR